MIRKYWQVAACAAMACFMLGMGIYAFAKADGLLAVFTGAMAILATGAWVLATITSYRYASRYR